MCFADQVTFLSPGDEPGGHQLVCLSSSKMAAVLGVLAVVLVASLVTSICMCVRAREWKRRFLHRRHRFARANAAGFPYGRVVDF